jgi:uracil-DNA glycosylase
MQSDFKTILKKVRACDLCASQLPLEPRPVVQLHPEASILIAGQAPGEKVHETGIPFDDPSGKRLREWMGIDAEFFYDPKKVAILPMGFCYPGTGKSGDLPPRPECAAQWRHQILEHLPNIQLTLVIGQYAQNWHLQNNKKSNLTETVKAWQDYWPILLPLPHPSPRNNIWLKKNPWFEAEILPALKEKIANI